MKLWVLTACSRPENLALVWDSLHVARRRAELTGASLRWLVRYDREQKHVGGQAVKNWMLDEATDGWVWVLDDDTLAHPEFLVRVRDAATSFDAVVVSQLRADGRVLEASPENVRVGGIDIGQVALRRELIGDERIPESYEGDGLFLERVLREANVLFINEQLSYHNRLRPGTS